MDLMEQLAKTKKDAHTLAVSSAPDRQAVLSNIASLLNERREEIKKINKIDINNAEDMELSSAMIDRLRLTDKEIDKVVRKVRALVINNKTKEILLVHYAGLYMLPGGSIDNGETEIEALRREVLEESGIEIEDQQAVSYLLINSYDRNYFDRKSGNVNRLTQTIFFEVDREILTALNEYTRMKQRYVSELGK